MKRVLILGCSGAGKSTLARQLGHGLDIPVTHLDQIYWQPGWVEGDDADLREKVSNIVAHPAWIIDGGYSQTYDLRFPHADTIIYLDYPRCLCVFRVLKRIATTYGQVRVDMAPGCPEQIDGEFFKYVWTFNRKWRARNLEWLNAARDNQSVKVFTHPRQTAKWLGALRKDADSAQTL